MAVRAHNEKVRSISGEVGTQDLPNRTTRCIEAFGRGINPVAFQVL